MYPFNFKAKKAFVDLRKIFIAMPFDDKYEFIYTDIIIPAIKKVNSNFNNKKFFWQPIALYL